MQPAGQLAQIRVRQVELLRGGGEQLLGRVGLHARDLQQVRDREQPLLRAVVEVAPDPAALGVGRLDHPSAGLLQRTRLVAALELGGGAGGEDPQGGDVLLAGLHRAGVEHGDVAEVHVLGGAQADREVALEAELDCRRVVREALGQRLRERHPRVLGDDGAGLALGVVLERLVHEGAVVPADERAHVLSGGIVGLGDQDELGRERLGDVAGEAAQELLAHRARGACGDRGEQLLPAETLGCGGH